MLQAFIDFQGVAEGLFANAANRVHPALMVGSGLLLRWLVLFWMYRRRLFLRV
jgi:predicted acyltransferase